MSHLKEGTSFQLRHGQWLPVTDCKLRKTNQRKKHEPKEIPDTPGRTKPEDYDESPCLPEYSEPEGYDESPCLPEYSEPEDRSQTTPEFLFASEEEDVAPIGPCYGTLLPWKDNRSDDFENLGESEADLLRLKELRAMLSNKSEGTYPEERRENKAKRLRWEPEEESPFLDVGSDLQMPKNQCGSIPGMSLTKFKRFDSGRKLYGIKETIKNSVTTVVTVKSLANASHRSLLEADDDDGCSTLFDSDFESKSQKKRKRKSTTRSDEAHMSNVQLVDTAVSPSVCPLSRSSPSLVSQPREKDKKKQRKESKRIEGKEQLENKKLKVKKKQDIIKQVTVSSEKSKKIDKRKLQKSTSDSRKDVLEKVVGGVRLQREAFTKPSKDVQKKTVYAADDESLFKPRQSDVRMMNQTDEVVGTEKKKLEEELNILRCQTEKLQAEKNALVEQKSQLSTRLHVCEEEILVTNKRCELLEKANSVLESRVAEMEKDSEDKATEISSLIQKLTESKNLLIRTQNDVEQANKHISRINNKLKCLEVEKSWLMKNANDANITIENLRSEKSTLEKRHYQSENMNNHLICLKRMMSIKDSAISNLSHLLEVCRQALENDYFAAVEQQPQENQSTPKTAEDLSQNVDFSNLNTWQVSWTNAQFSGLKVSSDNSNFQYAQSQYYQAPAIQKPVEEQEKAAVQNETACITEIASLGAKEDDHASHCSAIDTNENPNEETDIKVVTRDLVDVCTQTIENYCHSKENWCRKYKKKNTRKRQQLITTREKLEKLESSYNNILDENQKLKNDLFQKDLQLKERQNQFMFCTCDSEAASRKGNRSLGEKNKLKEATGDVASHTSKKENEKMEENWAKISTEKDVGVECRNPEVCDSQLRGTGEHSGTDMAQESEDLEECERKKIISLDELIHCQVKQLDLQEEDSCNQLEAVPEHKELKEDYSEMQDKEKQRYEEPCYELEEGEIVTDFDGSDSE